MILIALILSVVFGSIGFLVTEKNARYSLSGYNTMSEQDRQQFDIVSYIRLFKQFHLTLAATLFIGVCLLSLIDNNWASIFMTVYPLVAYLYFLVKTAAYNKGKSGQKAGSYIAGTVLVVVIGTLLFTSFKDYKSSELRLNADKLAIEGSFGIKINRKQVEEQQLVDRIPEISYKENGFAAGDYAKGRFRTKDGRTVWLFVNKKASRFLWIKSAQGDIFYSHDQMDMQTLSRNIEQWIAGNN
ncbi:DUF3784 domain-containing protein [Dyadobacter sp. CY343]|uniref:DUF3784 domain-containing protein n=1 Tax=Dyadobacter sp. CY343 TaxID=2907299 RepID=UPI001F349B8A|nr:DUF3784 domain-containing protein [Dyadobacter sp. CY343]MCE7063314.1 DUF3784 domain-containing protein [Dyadobacter sp. CY343]